MSFHYQRLLARTHNTCGLLEPACSFPCVPCTHTAGPTGSACMHIYCTGFAVQCMLGKLPAVCCCVGSSALSQHGLLQFIYLLTNKNDFIGCKCDGACWVAAACRGPGQHCGCLFSELWSSSFTLLVPKLLRSLMHIPLWL